VAGRVLDADRDAFGGVRVMVDMIQPAKPLAWHRRWPCDKKECDRYRSANIAGGVGCWWFAYFAP